MANGNGAAKPPRPLLSRVFSRENLAALALCLIVIAVIIATTDSAPQWIYQGF